MRRPRLLGAPAAQSLCAFCACRVYGETAAAHLVRRFSGPRRRFLSSASRLHQSAQATESGVAETPAPSQGDGPNGGLWATESYTTLTPAEQRAKEERRQLREKREAEEMRKAEEAMKRLEQSRQEIAKQAEREAPGLPRRDATDKRGAQQATTADAMWNYQKMRQQSPIAPDRPTREPSRRTASPLTGTAQSAHARAATGPSVYRRIAWAPEDKADGQQRGDGDVGAGRSFGRSDNRKIAAQSQSRGSQSSGTVERSQKPDKQRVSMPSFGSSAQPEAPKTTSTTPDTLEGFWGMRGASTQPDTNASNDDGHIPSHTSDAPASAWGTGGDAADQHSYDFDAQLGPPEPIPTLARYPGRTRGYSSSEFQRGIRSGDERTKQSNVTGQALDDIFKNMPGGGARRSQSSQKSMLSNRFPFRFSQQGPPDAYGTGYQASPFDSRDYKPGSHSKGAPDEPWQHLSSQQTQDGNLGQSQQEQGVREYSPQPEAGRTDNRDAVETQFNRFLAERPQRPIVQPSFGTPSNSARLSASEGPVRVKRCARCLEDGHHASECRGPIRARCHRCGQVGHIVRDCPSPRVAKRHDSSSKNEVASWKSNGNSRFGGRHDQDEWSSSPTRGPRSHDSWSDERPDDFSSPRQQRQRPISGAHRVFPGASGDTDGPQAHNSNIANAISEERQRPSEASSRNDGNQIDAPATRLGRMSSWGERPDDEPVRRGRASMFAAEVDDNDSVQASQRRDHRGGRRQGRRGREIDDDDDEGEAIREEKAERKAVRKAERDRRAREALMGRLDADGERIDLPDFISVSNLAQALGIRYDIFVSHLEQLGYDDMFPGKVLNAETSGMIAMEYNFEPVFESASNAEQKHEQHDILAQPEIEDKSMLLARPPVVTIMGHVDHGKTTILDYLRKSSVAAGEAGGITQHIGAFSVPLAASGKTITFLDTPGHAAFLAMRQRGANVTDIVVLVVAADDSVKPQTLEALRHARGANVPIIVAVNKIDKPEADLQKVKQDLARHGIEIEDFGGDTQVVPVSGKTGQGMDELEEAVVTLSEILDHRADRGGAVEGWVLEGSTTKAGRVATVLVRRGTLRLGTVIVAGETWARVRTLKNAAGEMLDEVGPGMPAEVDGWRDQPSAGDEVLQAPSEQKASSVVEYRSVQMEREKTAADMEAINEARRIEQERRAREKQLEKQLEVEGIDPDSIGQEEEADVNKQMSVPFIIKADVSGSAEAISAYIMSVSSEMITPQVLMSQVGKVNESDIDLAAATRGNIISFNNPADEPMKALAESKGVRVLEHNIIYRIVEEVRTLLEDKLPPVITQRVVGEAEIGATFDIGLGGRRSMKIAGCKVRNGTITKGARVRVLRGAEKIYDGTLQSLKNVKKDVQEMRKGTECGMGFDKWQDFAVGDQIQTYEEISERRKLYS